LKRDKGGEQSTEKREKRDGELKRLLPLRVAPYDNIIIYIIDSER